MAEPETRRTESLVPTLIGGALLGASILLLGALRQVDGAGGFDPGRLGPYLPIWVGIAGLVLAALGIAYALVLMLVPRAKESP